MLRTPEVTVALVESHWPDPRTWVVAWGRLGIDGLEHEEDKELEEKKKETTHLGLRKGE